MYHEIKYENCLMSHNEITKEISNEWKIYKNQQKNQQTSIKIRERQIRKIKNKQIKQQGIQNHIYPTDDSLSDNKPIAEQSEQISSKMIQEQEISILDPHPDEGFMEKLKSTTFKLAVCAECNIEFTGKQLMKYMEQQKSLVVNIPVDKILNPRQELAKIDQDDVEIIDPPHYLFPNGFLINTQMSWIRKKISKLDEDDKFRSEAIQIQEPSSIECVEQQFLNDLNQYMNSLSVGQSNQEKQIQQQLLRNEESSSLSQVIQLQEVQQQSNQKQILDIDSLIQDVKKQEDQNNGDRERSNSINPSILQEDFEDQENEELSFSTSEYKSSEHSIIENPLFKLLNGQNNDQT